MQKRKKICCLLAGILVLGLMSGCGEKDGKIKMSTEEFLSYCDLNVELTEENWQDYFEIRENVTEDELYGDEYTTVERIEPSCYNVLEIRDGGLGVVKDTTAFRFHITGIWHLTEYNGEEVEDNAMDMEIDEDYDIEWTVKQAEEILLTSSYSREQGADAGYRRTATDVDSCELVKVIGTMDFAHIPDDKWNVDENGVRYIIVVKAEDDYAEYYENRLFRQYILRNSDEPYENEYATIRDMIGYATVE